MSSTTSKRQQYRFVGAPFDIVLNKCIEDDNNQLAVDSILSMLSRFNYLTRHCQDIVIVEGMPASGKSTFLNSLVPEPDTETVIITEPKQSSIAIITEAKQSSIAIDNASAYWDTTKIVDNNLVEYKPLKYMYTHADDAFCQHIVQLFLLMAKLRKCLDVLECAYISKRKFKRVYIERFIFSDLFIFFNIQQDEESTTKECTTQIQSIIRRWGRLCNKKQQIDTKNSSSESIDRILTGLMRINMHKFRFIFKGTSSFEEFDICYKRLTSTRSDNSSKGYFTTIAHQKKLFAAFGVMARVLASYGFQVSTISAESD